jgi:hypothetical protein
MADAASISNTNGVAAEVNSGSQPVAAQSFQTLLSNAIQDISNSVSGLAVAVGQAADDVRNGVISPDQFASAVKGANGNGAVNAKKLLDELPPGKGRGLASGDSLDQDELLNSIIQKGLGDLANGKIGTSEFAKLFEDATTNGKTDPIVLQDLLQGAYIIAGIALPDFGDVILDTYSHDNERVVAKEKSAGLVNDTGTQLRQADRLGQYTSGS